MNRETDLKLTKWGTEVFIKSTGRPAPDKFMLGAHYADDYPSQENIEKWIQLSCEVFKELTHSESSEEFEKSLRNKLKS